MDPTTLLTRSADVFGDHVAFGCGDRRQTYRELLERAARLANALRDAGIRPGERVAMLGDNSFEAMEQVAGLAIGGYVRCALYAHETPENNLHLLRLTGAAALLVHSGQMERLAPLLAEAHALRVVLVVVEGEGPDAVAGYEEALGAASPTPPDLPLAPDDPHLIRFSAGTTGRPKGILHTVAGWQAMGNEFALAFGGFTERDRYLAAGPLSHATGVLTWPLIAAGASILAMPAFDPAQWPTVVERERITVGMLGPTMIQLVVRHPDARARELENALSEHAAVAEVCAPSITGG